MRKYFILLLLMICIAGCKKSTEYEIATSYKNKTHPSFITPTAVIEFKHTPKPSTTISHSFPGWVLPEPERVYTVSEYNNLAPSTNWGMNKPGICFSIYPRIFMEKGDFYTAEEWLDHVQVEVDGNMLQRNSLLLTDAEGLIKSDTGTGEILWQVPDGSPLRPCYTTSLDVGIHVVMITVTRTSGEQESFTWSFEIVE